MPTSATGDEAGFTLVELMVVLVIMGLAASVVVLAARPGPSLAQEAERFGARLVRAQEEAVLTNRPIGVQVTPGGYAFRARTLAGWTPLQDGPFKPVRWGEGVAASPGEVRFESTGAAEPLTVLLTREARRMRVAVDAAGNVTVDAGA